MKHATHSKLDFCFSWAEKQMTKPEIDISWNSAYVKNTDLSIFIKANHVGPDILYKTKEKTWAVQISRKRAWFYMTTKLVTEF